MSGINLTEPLIVVICVIFMLLYFFKIFYSIRRVLFILIVLLLILLIIIRINIIIDNRTRMQYMSGVYLSEPIYNNNDYFPLKLVLNANGKFTVNKESQYFCKTKGKEYGKWKCRKGDGVTQCWIVGNNGEKIEIDLSTTHLEVKSPTDCNGDSHVSILSFKKVY